MAAHELFLLHCGWLDDRQPDGSVLRIPVPAYVIRSAAGRIYLVDTGNPASLIGAPNCQPWYPAACTITPADDPIARLAELGIAPQDVDAIIATHFDFDHAGRFDAFGPLGTQVWVQRAQLAAALSDRDRYAAGLWNVPGLRWIRVDGDLQVEPGLMLIRTDGHAIGHQSLALETASGWVILAVDAIDNGRMLQTRAFPAYFDAEATNRSMDRLVQLGETLEAPIIFGHDPEQWATLRQSPEPFGFC